MNKQQKKDLIEYNIKIARSMSHLIADPWCVLQRPQEIWDRLLDLKEKMTIVENIVEPILEDVVYNELNQMLLDKTATIVPRKINGYIWMRLQSIWIKQHRWDIV